MNIQLSIFALFFIFLSGSCSNDKNEPQREFIPYVGVNEQLNLTNIQNTPLRQDRGYVYLAAGVRGIIVVRKNSNQYLAFERNCPYQPLDSCATVEADASGIFLTDLCCGSKFDFGGQVISGPSRYPLLQYQVSQSGNMLYINN